MYLFRFFILFILLSFGCTSDEYEELDLSGSTIPHLKCTIEEFYDKGNLRRKLRGTYEVVHTTSFNSESSSGLDTLVYEGFTARFRRNTICLYQDDVLLSESSYELKASTWVPFQILLTDDSLHPLNGQLIVVCKGNLIIQTGDGLLYDVVPGNGPPETFLRRID